MEINKNNGSIILPCPFCGCDCKIASTTFGDSSEYYYRVVCKGENQHTLDCWSDSENEAINVWNNRSRPTKIEVN